MLTETIVSTAGARQPRAVRRARLSRVVEAARTVPTPSLLLDSAVIVANYERLSRAFSGCDIYYAMKANPAEPVLDALIHSGCGMEVASWREAETALRRGADPRRIWFTAPFKLPEDIARATAAGISVFVCDAPSEIAKIAEHAPRSSVVVRMAVGDGPSANPMGAKFGANPDDVVELLASARDRGLTPRGLTFHVGSQCLDELAWCRAIDSCAPVWHEARRRGLDLSVIDVGGGYPLRYTHAVPSIETIAAAIRGAAKGRLGANVRIAVEPGRWLLRNAGVMVASVIGTARRGADDWVYLDLGVYNGLIDTSYGLVYPMRTLSDLVESNQRPLVRRTIAGPSCDGADVIIRDALCPPLAVGERVLFFQTGAYTTAFERFNGLAFPRTHDIARS